MLGGYPMGGTVPYTLKQQHNLLLFRTDPSNTHNRSPRRIMSRRTEVPGSMIFHRMAHRTPLGGCLVGRPVLLSRHIPAVDQMAVFDSVVEAQDQQVQTMV